MRAKRGRCSGAREEALARREEALARLGDWLANSFEPGNDKWVVERVSSKYGELHKRLMRDKEND